MAHLHALYDTILLLPYCTYATKCPLISPWLESSLEDDIITLVLVTDSP